MLHPLCFSVADLGAAVAMLAGAGSIQGVVRFLQLSEERCLIDGTIDGLEPGPHGLHVHTLGDLTLDCLRLDQCFIPVLSAHQHRVECEGDGESSVIYTFPKLKPGKSHGYESQAFSHP